MSGPFDKSLQPSDPSPGQHSPEPWSWWQVNAEGMLERGHQPPTSIGRPDGHTIARCIAHDTAANARRIVACVNACRGHSTEGLEQLAARGMSLVHPDDIPTPGFE